MKLLIFEWAAGTFTYGDITETFASKGINYRTVSYQFKDKNEDAFFEYRFTKVLKEDTQRSDFRDVLQVWLMQTLRTVTF